VSEKLEIDPAKVAMLINSPVLAQCPCGELLGAKTFEEMEVTKAKHLQEHHRESG
jgi:hypothetical protein